MLTFGEVPALFWVLLAGRESRNRLRFILASREAAARVAIREQVGRDVEAGREMGESGRAREVAAGAAALNAAMAAASVTMAEAGRNLAKGMAAAFRLGCAEAGHEVLWVEGRGRVCLDCERQDAAAVTVSVNGTILKFPHPES